MSNTTASQFQDMTAAEDLFYQQLMNDSRMYECVMEIKTKTYSYIEYVMSNLLLRVNKHLLDTPGVESVDEMLVFLHMMETTGCLKYVQKSIIAKHANTQVEKGMPENECMPGDIVVHTNNLLANLEVRILAEDANNPDKWCVAAFRPGTETKAVRREHQFFWYKVKTKFVARPSEHKAQQEECIPGDIVTHCSLPLAGRSALILETDPTSSQRWCIQYTDTGKKGVWNKCNTILGHRPRRTSHITDPPCVSLHILDAEIAEHLKKANQHFNTVYHKLNPEYYMKAQITHITEINGTNIEDMSATDILHHISNVEDGISQLAKRNSESKFVAQETKRLKSFVAEAYELLDAKFATSTPAGE